VQPFYLTAKSSSVAAANWFVLDEKRDPMNTGLSVSDPSAAGWVLSVTMDDPVGYRPNPQLNPGAPGGTSGGGTVGGKVVSIFGSSQVGGWGSSTTFCFGAGTGAAIGGISQPVYALQLTSTANAVAGTTSSGIPTLTILQAGPR